MPKPSQSELIFHTSSYSGPKTENCVEVAEGRETLVRDTQHRETGHLGFPAEEWQAFLDEVKASRL
ncbi:DUF397 domain-containing protein [Streptomonospora salina]|uniref:DUF397 domain-containing protein n=1 Tax=Streptomonospora salina TaxID=104205 RepID=A0A841EDP1_9ACTN|nr:DUF397 domain-containing protein [Streptomonospora salina]MBB5998570.1 hypothetical protein [Streptomonospora salina]